MTDGETVVEVPITVPIPLLMLVELAFATTHASVELCPDIMDEGAAVNEVIVGASCVTVAEHVVVATVEDASVACSVIEYTPGETESVCVVDVEPFPHRNAMGITPSAEDADQVMFVAVGEPLQLAVNADASTAKENARSTPAAATADRIVFLAICILIILLHLT